MAVVARSKILLPLPVSLRMFVNVSSMFSAGWIGFVVDAGHVQHRLGELLDLFRGDVGGLPGRLQDGVGLGADLLRFAELAERGPGGTDQAGCADRAGGEPGHPAETTERRVWPVRPVLSMSPWKPFADRLDFLNAFSSDLASPTISTSILRAIYSAPCMAGTGRRSPAAGPGSCRRRQPGRR